MTQQGDDPALDPVVNEAIDRFERCVKWEGNARKLFEDDLKFANADADNWYQWPNSIRRNRDLDQKPCLTINKVRQHNLQIINNSKQNKPGIVVRGVGNGATFEAAQVWESLIRSIEYQSNASVAYDLATYFQVTCGIGYWRLITRYVDEKSFNQGIFIDPVLDPLSVYLDPDANRPDKSDSKFGFIFERLSREEFDQKYPKYKEYAGQSVLGNVNAWVTDDHVVVVEYYRVVEKKDELILVIGPDGEELPTLRSEMPDGIYAALQEKQPYMRTRPVNKKVCEYYLIIGNKIAKHNIWPDEEVPIIPIIGEEIVIEGQMDRKGHTRAMKDPQRMYNYWASAAVEYGALQTKTPWVGAAEAIEGYETYWNTSNTENYAMLPYNAFTEDGQPLEKPERIQPPVSSPVALDGMKISSSEIEMVSGQYAPQMGAQGNERSAKAIQERQRQGDNATYHYIDNQGIAIRRTGKIILRLIPIILDTKQVVMVLGRDNTDLEVEIDPFEKQAFQVQLNHDNEVIKRVLNPTIGKFEVQADVGPAYATKREEAFNAMTLILTQAPELVSLIGDLLFKSGDFPLADEAAARLKRMVPPMALGKGPSQNEQQLQMQVQNLTTNMTKLVEDLAKAKLKLAGKEQMPSSLFLRQLLIGWMVF